MISCTKLLCGSNESGDKLRYGGKKHARPVVVWNMTSLCNLRCKHCYSNAGKKSDAGELSTAEAKYFIDDLAQFEVPVILFSGGEPLMREDIFELGSYAVKRNMRTVISTNGTLITKKLAGKIRNAGFSYVGISLDGLRLTNDGFRGQAGAFNNTLRGIRNCIDAGQRAGLRFTINIYNYREVGEIFRLAEEERIPRVCFYHLVYSGRAERMKQQALSNGQSRSAVDLIFDKTRALCHKNIEILTVDNHADGPYLYMRLLKEKSARAAEALSLLKWNGGNASGIAIAAVDNLGEVHADQFWRHHSFGSVRKRKFGDIWTDLRDPLMAGLKDRKKLLKGRCFQKHCRWIDLCNGNFRVRAESVHNDVWAEDPACYLSEEEIRNPIS